MIDGNDEARRAVLALLAGRAPGATVCPSEAARSLGDAAWWAAMPAVHRAVDALVAEGAVALSWRGVAMPIRQGPYRITRVRR